MRVNVAREVEHSPLGGLHVLIVSIGFLIMLIDGYDLVSMAMVVPVVSAEWSLTPSDFAVPLSAVLIGVLFGSLLAGILGDRIGRRWTICIMLGFAGTGMLLTPSVEGLGQLTVARFITGIGAGGSIPVTLAYTQEFMPGKHRNLLTTLMYTGAGMGSVAGGAIGPTLIESGGWPLVFYVGGAVPVIMVLVVAFLLPESLRFMVSRGCEDAVAGRLLARLKPTFEHQPQNTYFLETARTGGRGVVAELFTGPMLPITLLIWLLFFTNQFLVFFVGTWMPTLLVDAGVTLERALHVVALFNLGGVFGGIAFGRAGDHLEPGRVLIITYLLAAVLLAGFGLSAGSLSVLMITAVLAGAGVIGSSFLLGVMATGLYPTRARATGIGWALAVGRFGAISSPLLGGYLLGRGIDFGGMMYVATVPAFVSSVAVFALWRLTRRRQAAGPV